LTYITNVWNIKDAIIFIIIDPLLLT